MGSTLLLSMLWCKGPMANKLFFKNEYKLWISLPYVVIWTIWWIRNRMVFDGFKLVWSNEIQNLKHRLGFWVKGWNDRFPYDPDYLLLNLDQVRLWHEGSWTTWKILQDLRWRFLLIIVAAIETERRRNGPCRLEYVSFNWFHSVRGHFSKKTRFIFWSVVTIIFLNIYGSRFG